MDEPQANTNSQDLQDSPQLGLEGSHHLPPYSLFCAWPWGQHPNVILSRDSQIEVSKFSKLGPPRLWRTITLCANLLLRWNLSKNCSPHQNLSNNMWHATCTHINRGDSWLLVVGSQIGSLIPNLSFGHNLCFRYPNGSCEPISNIYVPRAFRWYNELFNRMNVNPWNYSLKIWKSVGTPIPKVGAHLGVWRFIP
jgi:hypothetical protein